MDASIVIVVKNGGDNFPMLLERIFSQKFGGSYEVIVIDSGSTDGTLEAARRYPLILKQIPPDQFHHSRTRNLGAEMAQGDYVVYVTQDALPLDDDWLQQLIDSFDSPSVAMVTGRQLPQKKVRPPEQFFYRYHFPEFKIVVQSGAAIYYRNNIFISDVNSAYRKVLLLEYKFAENIVMAEDKEIAVRFLENGLSIVYQPLASVIHSHDYSLKELFGRHLDYGLANRQGVDRLPKTAGKAVSGLAAYLGAEWQYLADNRLLHWAPYAIIYEIVKYAGLWLGKAGIMKGPAARSMKLNHERTV